MENNDQQHLISVKLITHSHMLGGETSTSSHLVETGELAWDFLVKANAFTQDCRVFLNGNPVGMSELKQAVLNKDDDLNLVVIQNGDSVGSLLPIALVFATGGLGLGAYLGYSGITAALINIAGGMAMNWVAGSLSGGSGSNSTQTQEKQPESYSITGGSNSYRQRQPIPIVLGSHRLSPDYTGRAFMDYVNDMGASKFIENGTMNYALMTVPAFVLPSNKPWEQITDSERQPAGFTYYSGNPAWGTEYADYIWFYGDGSGAVGTPFEYQIAIRWRSPAIGETASNGITYIATYFDYVRGPQETSFGNIEIPVDWQLYPEAGTQFQYEESGGFYRYETTQRLNSNYCYGFGDLEIKDHYIGTTPATDFNSVTITPTLFTNVATSNPGWLHAPDTSAGASYEFPTNCESVEGADLQQNKNVINSGWITRQTSRPDADYLEVDVSGRLFRNGGSGPENLSRDFACEYRIYGSSTWIVSPTFETTIENGDMYPVRKSFGWAVPQGRYEVRVRRVSEDETDAANICDIKFESFKAYGFDQKENYPALNRLGVQILATSQLNGTVNKWTSQVRNKCWTYTGAAYDGSAPGQSVNWSWTYSSNPAWLAMYVILGGFIDKAATGPTSGRGWMPYKTASSESRLFGAGLHPAMVDFESLFYFSKWCDKKQLTYNAVKDSQTPCADLINEVMSCGRGSLTWTNGKLGAVWADPADVQVAIFGMGNIIEGSFEVSYSNDKRSDEIIGTYLDASDFYTSKQVRATVPGVLQPVNETTVSLNGVTTEEQAQRECNLRASDQKYHARTITFQTSIDGMVPSRGDVIGLAHDLTEWAHSGRLQDLNLATGVIELPFCIANTEASSDYWIQLRMPNGDIQSFKVSLGNAPTQSFYLGAAALAEFENVFPEDVIFSAGPRETPGKRCRVLKVEPAQQGTVRITCTDDYAEYYAQEYSLDGVDVKSGEMTVARVFNAYVETRQCGNYLTWEIDNCLGANVAANIALTSGVLSVAGTELKLPSKPTGTTISFSLTPLTPVGAYASSGCTTTFTY